MRSVTSISIFDVIGLFIILLHCLFCEGLFFHSLLSDHTFPLINLFVSRAVGCITFIRSIAIIFEIFLSYNLLLWFLHLSNVVKISIWGCESTEINIKLWCLRYICGFNGVVKNKLLLWLLWILLIFYFMVNRGFCRFHSYNTDKILISLELAKSLILLFLFTHFD